jgi:hypothetical protein
MLPLYRLGLRKTPTAAYHSTGISLVLTQQSVRLEDTGGDIRDLA